MLHPVVLDVRYIWAYTVYYAIAFLWAIAAIFNGLNSLSATGGALISNIWIGSIIILSALLVWLTQTNFAEAEKWICISWIAIVSLYPASIIYQFVAEGDTTRGAASVSSLLYLIFPIARWIYLVRKTSKKGIERG